MRFHCIDKFYCCQLCTQHFAFCVADLTESLHIDNLSGTNMTENGWNYCFLIIIFISKFFPLSIISQSLILIENDSLHSWLTTSINSFMFRDHFIMLLYLFPMHDFYCVYPPPEKKSSDTSLLVVTAGHHDERVDAYWDHYRPYELTSLDEVYTYHVPNSIR